MIAEKINKLKKEKKVVILAHYYVPDEVQAIADYVGDSFYLSKIAKNTDAEKIIFCGVSFMGESAAIMNPNKKVFMPDIKADCAMAHMVDITRITELRNKYDDLFVVCYINSSAEIKTYSDVCVTSANAIKVVKNLPGKNIFFIPDGNLGQYVKEQVPEKNIILNEGYCPIHAAITKEDVLAAKAKWPKAKFLVHPECRKEILEESDYIGSTSGIIDYVIKDDSKEYIIGTEIGVLYELKKKCPDKNYYPVRSNFICEDMKLVNLEKILEILEKETNIVQVSEEVSKKALIPLEKMLEIVE